MLPLNATGVNMAGTKKLSDARVAWARRVYDPQSRNENYRSKRRLAKLCGISHVHMIHILRGERRRDA